MNFLLWILRAVLFPVLYVARPLQRLDDWAYVTRLRRSAIPEGTKVRIVGCKHNGCSHSHDEIWEIVHYNVDADDYRLCLMGADESCPKKYDYATREVLEVLEKIPEAPWLLVPRNK
jgi:hypothetical protein